MDNPGEVLLLSKTDVDRVLSPKDCLERCIETFRWVGDGKVDQVNPVHIRVIPPDSPYGPGSIAAYPSNIRPLKIGGVKWLSTCRFNAKRGLPFLSAIDIINDTENAMPLAVMDGASVTAMRTAGHAGVGAKYLAKNDSKIIAIIGCGIEGRTHLRMINEIFDLQEVRACDIFPEIREKYQKEMAEELDLNIIALDSAEKAVKGADIVCIVTTAKEPVVMEDWLSPGCHVCAAFGFTDLDPNCVLTFDKWVVGWYGRDLEWIEGREAGTIGGLRAGQFSKKNIFADLATEIVRGKKPGRENDTERTVMTHMGMPALDIAVAALVYEKAKEKGVGTTWKVF